VAEDVAAGGEHGGRVPPDQNFERRRVARGQEAAEEFGVGQAGFPAQAVAPAEGAEEPQGAVGHRPRSPGIDSGGRL